jgi:hypothetical protein
LPNPVQKLIGWSMGATRMLDPQSAFFFYFGSMLVLVLGALLLVVWQPVGALFLVARHCMQSLPAHAPPLPRLLETLPGQLSVASRHS